MVKYLIYLQLFLFCMACSPPKLITPRNNLKTNLRLDGYYVYKFSQVNSGEDLSIPKFIYKNGVILNLFTRPTHSDISIQSYINGEFSEYFEKIKNDRTSWELVSISEKNITIEWRNTSLGPKNQKTIIEKGIILNDTTFKITSLHDRKGQLVKSVSNVYEFKKFSPKPDSANKFIK